MSKNIIQATLLAACLGAAGASHASVQVYTDSASFLAAVTAAATDTFDDLTTDAPYPYPSPLARHAGAYTYTAAASRSGGGADTLYRAGDAPDYWLSTNVADDTITLSGFSGPINAIGGLFFGTDFSGHYAPGGSVILTISDGTTTTTSTVANATTSSFFGLVSSTAIVSLTITAQTGGSNIWPTLNNLVVAVPEPQTYALMLTGLAVIGASLRRRRQG